jgi:quercetin dioxygenase-like cupin family protein
MEGKIPFFIDASSRDTKELAPGVRTRTFWGEQILLSLVEVEANSEMPLHTQPPEQGGMIIEGEFEIGTAGEVKVLKPGDMYIIPGGVEHYAKTGAKKVKALGIYSPVREGFKY